MKWGKFSRKGLESIAQSTARLNIWHGAVRSGKTICSIVRWLEFVKNGPEGDLLMVGKTERTLYRNILGPIRDIVGRKRFKYNRGMGELTLCGRLIYIAGANDERSADKIRGLTLAGAYCDELTLWPESMFSELLNRLSVAGAKLFGTTNPDGPFHWLKVNYLDKLGLNLKQWHFELGDNPNLPADYIESLKMEHVGVFYDRMIKGLWVLAQGVIYDGFDLVKHGYDDADEPQAFDAQDVTIDYGTQNAFAALLMGVKGDTSWVRREYYYSGRDEQQQKTDAEYSADLKEWLAGLNPRWVVIDPSAASMIAQLRRDGFRVKPAENDVVPGIGTVAGRISNGKLRVHRKRCPNLVKEFGVYAWDPKAAKRGEDKPIKQHDHALDALRYHEYTLFGKVRAQAGYYGGIDV